MDYLNIAIDFNRFYMKGVDGLENYGIINQPNLPSAIVAATVTVGGGTHTEWFYKTGAQIYDDIVAMISDMSARSGGHVGLDTKYKLVVGRAVYAQLIKQNSLGTETVIGMIKRSLPNLEVVVSPEYDDDASADSGVQRMAQLIAVEVEGIPTGELGFSEKLSAGRVVPYMSHLAQKFMAGTYGAIIYRPVFVTTMLGV